MSTTTDLNLHDNWPKINGILLQWNLRAGKCQGKLFYMAIIGASEIDFLC